MMGRKEPSPEKTIYNILAEAALKIDYVSSSLPQENADISVELSAVSEQILVLSDKLWKWNVVDAQ
jgi:hypothetical protein